MPHGTTGLLLIVKKCILSTVYINIEMQIYFFMIKYTKCIRSQEIHSNVK